MNKCREIFEWDMPTPAKLAEDLSWKGFNQSQAEAIAADVYQPLLKIIEALVDELEKKEGM